MTGPQRAWLLLALVVAGWALGVAFAAELRRGTLDVVAGALGAAAGYGVAQIVERRLERRGPRGQLKYWRGRAFFDEEER